MDRSEFKNTSVNGSGYIPDELSLPDVGMAFPTNKLLKRNLALAIETLLKQAIIRKVNSIMN